METERRHIRISDRSTGTVLAEGAKGWDITLFEGNFYIRSHCLKGKVFKSNHIPGICPYKGLYVGLDLQLPQSSSEEPGMVLLAAKSTVSVYLVQGWIARQSPSLVG